MSIRKFAVIVAGGSGTRMKSAIPKQFLLLKGLPILMQTLQQFHQEDPLTELILVLPEAHFSTWERLVEEYHFDLTVQLVKGGNSRFGSVKNALAKVEDDSLVVVHDAVRPLVHQSTITEAWKQAQQHGAAIPTLPLKDSIRVIQDDGKSKAVDRSQYCLVQTPQAFQSTILNKAYETEEKDFFTDDASVVEHAGHKVSLFEGTHDNIKITTPEDLLIGEALFKNQ